MWHSWFSVVLREYNRLNTATKLKDGLAVSEQGTNAELLFITIVTYNKKNWIKRKNIKKVTK